MPPAGVFATPNGIVARLVAVRTVAGSSTSELTALWQPVARAGFGTHSRVGMAGRGGRDPDVTAALAVASRKTMLSETVAQQPAGAQCNLIGCEHCHED